MNSVVCLVKEIINDLIIHKKHEYLPVPLKLEQDEIHLEKTIAWLKLACDNGDGGASSHYNLLTGKWLPPFPETTGYIIPTFFDYFNHVQDKDCFDRATKLTDWLGEVQLENGACMQGGYDKTRGKNPPIIFNTGQNILGFVRTYKETKDQKYLDCALKAGDFLVKNVDSKGVWNQYLHNSLPHTYNSRTAWALLQLAAETEKKDYYNIAVSNLDWIVNQQTKNGWFNNANFKKNEYPNTHGLAYTTRGLLESYLITNNPQYYESAKRTADKMLRLYEIRRQLRTFWDAKWKNHGKFIKSSTGNYFCLTGNVQISIVWMKLYNITKDPRYLSAAFKMLDFIKHLQHIDHKSTPLNGGIKGSFPCYGRYSILKLPNWAAKFFADALLLKINLMKELQSS